MTDERVAAEPWSLESRQSWFLDLISAYSEDRWAASWLTGIDQQIREAGGPWIALAADCGGWPVGYLAEGGWAPLTDEEREWLSTHDGAALNPRVQQT